MKRLILAAPLLMLLLASACATVNVEYGPQMALDTADIVYKEYCATWEWWQGLTPERQSHYFPMMENAWEVTMLMQRAALAWSINEKPPADYTNVLAMALDLIETLKEARARE